MSLPPASRLAPAGSQASIAVGEYRHLQQAQHRRNKFTRQAPRKRRARHKSWMTQGCYWLLVLVAVLAITCLPDMAAPSARDRSID